MKDVLKRIQNYSIIEVGEVPTRITKLTEEFGEWCETFLDRKSILNNRKKTVDELNDHILEEGCDSLIMVLDILFKQGFTIEELLHEQEDGLRKFAYSFLDTNNSLLKIMCDIGKWSSAYLEQIGFKVPKKYKSKETIRIDMLNHASNVLVMIETILRKEFSKELVVAKLNEKLNAWDKVLRHKGLIIVEEEDGEIIQNAMLCKKCNTIIISTHRHDYNVCGCENLVMVDGGFDYFKCSTGEGQNYESLQLCENDSLETMKNKLVWGNRGKDGKSPLTYKKLIDCDTEHLENILEYAKKIGSTSSFHKIAIESILKDRNV